MQWKEPTFGPTPVLRVLASANAKRKAQAYDLIKEQKKQKLNYPSWAQEWMRKYKADWNLAQSKGDIAGMRRAQQLADGLRTKLKEINKMPKWAQEQMQKQTVRWMEANTVGNVLAQKAAQKAAQSIRDKCKLIQEIAKKSPADAKDLSDLTAKWYAAHDHGIVDGKVFVKDSKEIKSAKEKYSKQAQTIIDQYNLSDNESDINKNGHSQNEEASQKDPTTSKEDPKEELKEDSIQKAIKITGAFEGRGYTNIAGNFDGQGLSLGFLQWNIGQGTLQPLLLKYINNYKVDAQTIFGNHYSKLTQVLNGSKQEQMNWAKSITDGRKIQNDWKEQFIKLCNTNEFQKIQNDAMSTYIDMAYNMADEFNLKSERGLALVFDIAVQNGGFKSSIKNSIKAKINTNQLTEKEVLTVIAQAAVDKSKAKYQGDVNSRKFTIVNGTGTVHGKSYNLEKDFSLTDQPFK
ncbi:hypothetical protein [Paenibacillus bovis]|uniref:Phage tail lysozyme domain-containing protein n=1 Tax=Paenibacillus bovis TaxID=1616788 RepID=A0A172ZB86_9BACL|nr:hypothetical protein [Paenibacillus bovis]ANF94906.1 hypothetical protein AR543_01900 [Paenibacillus bovis]